MEYPTNVPPVIGVEKIGMWTTRNGGAFAAALLLWTAAQAATAQLPGVLQLPTDLGGDEAGASDRSRRSLYSGPDPKPGPAILYAAPPRAPQLENTGAWRAQPILISG